MGLKVRGGGVTQNTGSVSSYDHINKDSIIKQTDNLNEAFCRLSTPNSTLILNMF